MDPYLDEEPSSTTGFDPIQLWRLFWRRRWLFVVPFVLCSGMAALAIRVMTPIYFSSGQIHIIYEPTSATVVPREVDRYSAYRPRDRGYMVFSTIENIVTGPIFLEKAARAFMKQYPQLVEVIREHLLEDGIENVDEDQIARYITGRLDSIIKVSDDGANLYRIGVRDTDPALAYTLARIVVDLFLQEERASRLRPATTTRDFLETQRAGYEQELQEYERRLNEFQRSMLSETLVGNPVNELNVATIEANLRRMRTDFQIAATDIAAGEQAVRAILGGLPNLNMIAQEAEIATILQELIGLELEEAIEQSSEGGVLDREEQLGSTRVRLNSALEARIAREYPRLGVMDRNRVTQYLYYRLYHNVSQQLIEQIENHIREYRDFRTRQPAQAAQLSRLQQDVQAARDMVNTIERDIARENMRLEASMSEIGYKMVMRREPKFPRRPIEPNKTKLYFMGLVLALGMGGGLVILAHFMDRSFQSVVQIERTLQLKVIGTLPMVENEYFQRRKRRKYWIWIVLVILILAVAAAGLLVVYPRLS